MTREELHAALVAINSDDHGYDPEADHIEADKLLLAFIDDGEVAAAFEAIAKWYA